MFAMRSLIFVLAFAPDTEKWNQLALRVCCCEPSQSEEREELSPVREKKPRERGGVLAITLAQPAIVGHLSVPQKGRLGARCDADRGRAHVHPALREDSGSSRPLPTGHTAGLFGFTALVI